jgi:hypothetical protein
MSRPPHDPRKKTQTPPRGLGWQSANDQLPSRTPARGPSQQARRLLLAGCAIGVVIVVGTLVAVLGPRGPMPRGEDFSTVNRVSGGPAEWIAAVCEPFLRIPATGFHLPNSTFLAVCQARIRPDDRIVNPILIARFPSEVPMQIDLANNGIEWYAFAVDQGELIVFATRSPLRVPDPYTNLGDSPMLEGLKQFGFNIYSSPGVEDDLCGKIRC